MTSSTRQVVLRISPILYGRMEARANQQQYDMHEWVLRAVIGELMQLQERDDRRAREALAASASQPATESAAERKPNAAHS